MSASTLLVRCPTWEHVENFYQRKVKEGRLSARVPFHPALGDEIFIQLELPDRELVACPASVQAVQPAADGKRFAILVQIVSFDDSVRRKLESAVEVGRGGRKATEPAAPVTPSEPRTRSGLSVPVPQDAPIDELVDPVRLLEADQVEDGVRDIYRGLLSELQGIQSKAAHEVLGVASDASVAEVRDAYFDLTKRYHPDLFSRHRSDAVAALVSEVFIHINRAYDRMRDSAVASGRAIAAGPALLAHDGWLAGFEDLGSVRPRAPLRASDLTVPQAALTAADAPGQTPSELNADALFDEASSDEDGRATLDFGPGMAPAIDIDVQEKEGRAALEKGDYEAASARFALILDHAPRARKIRALYHVAYGQLLLAQGDASGAHSQFEIALSHDADCEEAGRALAQLVPGRPRRRSLLRRLFRR